MTENPSQMERAKTDSGLLEELVHTHEIFILRCAGECTGHFVTRHDDAYACALEGFVQAVKSYDAGKGNFLAYARKVIRCRLIDENRRQRKFQPELPVAPELFSDLGGEDEVALRQEINSKIAVEEDRSLPEEIEAANGVFSRYGFTFFDLPDCSPKAQKTMIACRIAVNELCRNHALLQQMRSTGTLPIKKLEKICGVPRKILERHRKYVIAVTEILSGEYPGLTAYLRFFREENDQ